MVAQDEAVWRDEGSRAPALEPYHGVLQVAERLVGHLDAVFLRDVGFRKVVEGPHAFVGDRGGHAEGDQRQDEGGAFHQDRIAGPRSLHDELILTTVPIFRPGGRSRPEPRERRLWPADITETSPNQYRSVRTGPVTARILNRSGESG